MADGFEVYLPALRSGAASLAEDAHAVTDGGSEGAAAASGAAGAVGEGPLAGASQRLAEQIARVSGEVSRAVGAAGRTLETNAARYQSDDASVTSALSAVDFGGASW